jgi:hypothetical protein
VKCGALQTPVQTLEAGGLSVYLRAIGGVHGTRVAVDLTVLDVHIRGTCRNPNALRGDVGIRNVNLAAILCGNGVTIEFQVAIVNM